MVKATLHLIINFILKAIIFSSVLSCSFFDERSKMDFEGYRAERLDSIKNHYNKVLDNFLKNKDIVFANEVHLNYLNLLINQKNFFKKLIILNSNDSFYFISPDKRLLISKKASEIYFQNESLLRSFLLENLVRVNENFFSRKYFYQNYLLKPVDLSNIMNLPLYLRDLLNNFAVELLIKDKRSPGAYLNYIQQRNKDSELIFNLINGRLYGLEEERHLKSYLLEKHKKEFITSASLDISSPQFYQFKQFINQLSKNHE